MTAAETVSLPPRAEIDKGHTWNAESVFPTPADFDAACDSVPEHIKTVQAFKGRLSQGPDVWADFMDARDTLARLVGRIYTYGMMSVSVDSSDPAAMVYAGRARSLMGQTAAALAFFSPELLAIGRDTLTRWMDDSPRLDQYRHFVDDLFRRQQHVRSADVEETLGLVSDTMGSFRATYAALTDTDMQFRPALDSQGREHIVSQGTRYGLRALPDRTLRKNAYESFAEAHLAHKHTLANNLLGAVKSDVFNMRVRGFESPLEAALHDSNIPTAVFHNLLDVFKANLPTWHRYWDVRRRILGYESLHPWDIWAPLTRETRQVSYAQSVTWISAGMQPLGEDYVAALRKGCLEDRWVDIYPNVGKRQGAFSNGHHDTFPFIMMSYDNTMGAMSTLAHELGHSLHSYHSRKHQPQLYSRYTLFVAEVASNFNQALVRAHLREKYADDAQFQIQLIEEAMGNFHRYFFIMPTLARFELEVHERAASGKGLSADDMSALMADLFAEGYGDALQFDRDYEGITWATFVHLYANFYVYQYATGISAAHALADQVLNEGQPAAQRYLEFLSAGGRMYPIDALKHAGVDMTQPDAVETTFGVLADMVSRLETLAGV